MFRKKKELTVDVARANYQKYLKEVRDKQEQYKIELCDEIERYSRRGFLSTMTRHIHSIDRFITKEYLDELKVYFDAKGFTTKLIECEDGDGWLIIKWGEG